MIVVKRQEHYSINWDGKLLEYTDEHVKKFLDHDFLPILAYIASKGLDIEIPSILDGWDATFVYRKLNEPGHGLGRPAEELALFLHMRLYKTYPVWIEQKGLFYS